MMKLDSIDTFSKLSYKEKLKLLNERGRLLSTYTIDTYHFTLFRLNSFYVELKRHYKDSHYEWIHATAEMPVPPATNFKKGD